MNDNIPPQFDGKSLDCYTSISCFSNERARQSYEQIKAHLLDINHWNKIAELPASTFTIKNALGNTVNRTVQEGDYIQIDIPGPGLPSAKGYDWVRVEKIAEEQKNGGMSIILTLRPAPDPTQELPDTAHFFKQMATSSILLEQKDKNIFLHYAGRNEVINTDNTSMLDNLRNFMVGIGAQLGASFPQWKALIEGLGDQGKQH